MNNFNDKISVYVSRGNCLTPLGFNLDDNVKGIKKGETAISEIHDEKINKQSFYGGVIDKVELRRSFSMLNLKGDFSTLEMMMLLVVDEIKFKFKKYIDDRCGIIISTTKGNIDALSTNDIESYYLPHLAKKISNAIGLKTEPIVLSNACVSGIMAISVAKRLIQVGKFNHVIVIAGDIFSRFVFSGFQSFNAMSSEPCKPYDKKRAGMTLGEATAAIFVTRDRNILDTESCYEVIGDSSINDANHISGPSRTGEGLFRSISNAMEEGKVNPSEIDFISAHGTATQFNDEMEAQAFNRAKLSKTPVFSLKGYFGHTLGAAGLLETVISLAFAAENLIPVSIGYDEHGLTLPLIINTELKKKNINVVLKTASGFGGSNTAVLFKRCK